MSKFKNPARLVKGPLDLLKVC